MHEVLYSKQGNSVPENSDIYVARPGGTVIVDSDHKVSAIDETFPGFTTGSKYLMFLKHDVRTNSYRVERPVRSNSKGQQSGRSIPPGLILPRR